MDVHQNISKRFMSAVNRRSCQLANEMMFSHIRPALLRMLVDNRLLLSDLDEAGQGEKLLSEFGPDQLFAAYGAELDSLRKDLEVARAQMEFSRAESVALRAEAERVRAHLDARGVRP